MNIRQVVSLPPPPSPSTSLDPSSISSLIASPTPTSIAEPTGSNGPDAGACTGTFDQGLGRNVIPASCSSTAPATTQLNPVSTAELPFESVTAPPPQPTESIAGATPPTTNGVSGGAVAGVAIACLIGGAAIAAIILFFLFRRRQKRYAPAYTQSHLGHTSNHIPPEKGPVVATKVIGTNIDQLLPQPAEDDAITQALSKVRDNIKNHARSYYHSDPIREGSVDEGSLRNLAKATGLHTSVLASLFSDVSTRNEAIRVFLAWVVLSKCDGSRLPCLLPDNLSATAVAISNREGSNATLVSKWKVITGALLKEQPGSSSKCIAEAINEANAVLAPFVRGSVDGGQRSKNLEMILSRAAGLALVLFSQPGAYRFDFAGSGNALITFPALLQVIGDDVRVLNPPRVLWEREESA